MTFLFQAHTGSVKWCDWCLLGAIYRTEMYYSEWDSHDSIYLYLQHWLVGNKSVNYSKHSSKWALNCVCLLLDNFLYTLFLYLYSLIWCLKGSLKMEATGSS